MDKLCCGEGFCWFGNWMGSMMVCVMGEKLVYSFLMNFGKAGKSERRAYVVGLVGGRKCVLHPKWALMRSHQRQRRFVEKQIAVALCFLSLALGSSRDESLATRQAGALVAECPVAAESCSNGSSEKIAGEDI